MRRLTITGLLLCLAAGVAACAFGQWALAGLAVTSALALFGAGRRPELVLAAWLGLSPWASYVLRWPEERSLVTFDRVMVFAVVVGLVAQARARKGRLPAPGAFELLWLCYAAVGLGSALLLSTERAFALREAFDGFLTPALLFYAVRAGFDRTRGGRALFWAAALLALSMPWLGLYEFAARTDVLPWKSASILRDDVVRANGPFSQDNSYAIVSAMLAVALGWLPAALDLALDRATRLVARAASMAAGAAACVPLFRAVMAALVAAWALPHGLSGRTRTLARAGVVAMLVALACTPLLLRAAQTKAFQNRITDPSSAFSRAATYLAAVDVIRDHPLLGVGLASYRGYFDAKFGTAWYVDVDAVSGVGAENSPHNNVLGTWAELGALGLFFYLAASIVLAGEAWRRRSFGALSLMAIYWLPAMTLQSSIYPDITLYYFALLAVLLGPSRTDEWPQAANARGHSSTYGTVSTTSA